MAGVRKSVRQEFDKCFATWGGKGGGVVFARRGLERKVNQQQVASWHPITMINATTGTMQNQFTSWHPITMINETTGTMQNQFTN